MNNITNYKYGEKLDVKNRTHGFPYTVVTMVRLNYETVALNRKQVVGATPNLICQLLVYLLSCIISTVDQIHYITLSLRCVAACLGEFLEEKPADCRIIVEITALGVL